MDINKIKLKNNCLHICHYCLNYRTYRKNDVKKHYEKKKQCQLNYIPNKNLTFEEAYLLSINKRYYINFDHTNFTLEDYVFLINYYQEEFNFIEKEDFYEKKYKNYNKKKELLQELKECCLINNDEDNDKKHNHKEENDNKKEENDNKNNNDKKDFSCPYCYTEYKSKRSLVNHLTNGKKICDANRIIYEAKLKSKSLELTFLNKNSKNNIHNQESNNNIKNTKEKLNIKEEKLNIKEDKLNIKEDKSNNKRKNISITLKRRVWDTYIGRYIGIAKCLCCNLTEIDQLNFNCGHVISHYDGGDISIDNLRPICQSCNSSMGSMNMNDFINKYSLNKV